MIHLNHPEAGVYCGALPSTSDDRTEIQWQVQCIDCLGQRICDLEQTLEALTTNELIRQTQGKKTKPNQEAGE